MAELPDWIADHVRRYQETDGADGHMWDSSVVGGPGRVPTLLLTTKGRKSGKPLTIPLIYGQDGDDYVVVASRGGDARHPAWYLNLEANPDVEVQVGAHRFRAHARTADFEERERLWDGMARIFPPYNDYQNRTDREIPVVVLTPRR